MTGPTSSPLLAPCSTLLPLLPAPSFFPAPRSPLTSDPGPLIPVSRPPPALEIDFTNRTSRATFMP